MTDKQPDVTKLGNADARGRGRGLGGRGLLDVFAAAVVRQCQSTSPSEVRLHFLVMLTPDRVEGIYNAAITTTPRLLTGNCLRRIMIENDGVEKSDRQKAV